MPGGDGTGPAGMGSMTGRAAGYCAGYDRPGAETLTFGRGYGPGYGRFCGAGFRRGRRGRWAAPGAGYGYAAPPPPVYGNAPTRQQKIDRLVREAEYLEGALSDIRQRIEALQEKKTSE